MSFLISVVEKHMCMYSIYMKKGVHRTSKPEQMADKCFGLVGPHQCRVCLAALQGHELLTGTMYMT